MIAMLPYAAWPEISSMMDTYTENISDFTAFLQEEGLTMKDVQEAAASIHTIPIPAPHVGRVTLETSAIQGYGMFAKVKLAEGQLIAPARVGHEWTLLGRFQNHAKSANCEYVKNGDRLNAYALRDINLGEELTVNYRQVKEAIQ